MEKAILSVLSNVRFFKSKTPPFLKKKSKIIFFVQPTAPSPIWEQPSSTEASTPAEANSTPVDPPEPANTQPTIVRPLPVDQVKTDFNFKAYINRVSNEIKEQERQSALSNKKTTSPRQARFNGSYDFKFFEPGFFNSNTTSPNEFHFGKKIQISCNIICPRCNDYSTFDLEDILKKARVRSKPRPYGVKFCFSESDPNTTVIYGEINYRRPWGHSQPAYRQVNHFSHRSSDYPNGKRPPKHIWHSIRFHEARHKWEK